MFKFIIECNSLMDFGPYVIDLFLYEDFWKMIFWLDYIFAWWNIWVSIILLLPLRYFLMWMARPQCDTPLVILDNSSPNKFMTIMQSKVPDMYFLNISDTNVENDLIHNRSWLLEKRPIWCSWQVKKKGAPTMKLQKLWPKWWSISAKRWNLQL